MVGFLFWPTQLSACSIQTLLPELCCAMQLRWDRVVTMASLSICANSVRLVKEVVYLSGNAFIVDSTYLDCAAPSCTMGPAVVMTVAGQCFEQSLTCTA